MKESIAQIIELEWNMFHNVNGEDRADCQDKHITFEKMRNAQYSAWDDETIDSYLDDLKKSIAQGRSVVKEKYVRMMEHSEPEKYEVFKDILPEDSEEKKELVEQIWQLMKAQTEKMREKYPAIALAGRPLTQKEEHGWSSVETYQKGEMFTYSEKTLKLLLKHIKNLESQGIDIAFKIQENSVTCLGYKDMDAAEKAMTIQLANENGTNSASSGCTSCCGID